MSQDRVLASLRGRLAGGAVGDKLPTIRALMRDLRVSQPAVQSALQHLADLGLISSQVGRGTFITRTSVAAPKAPTVLVLSARAQSDRNQRVGSLLLSALSARGARPLQVVYERLDHAMDALGAGIAFDITVVQSQLETVPIRLLDFLQRGARPVVIDGSRLSGIDVDIVASDWPSAVDLGVRALRDAGHRRIGFLMSPSPARSMEDIRRRFTSLRGWMDWSVEDCPLVTLARSPDIGEPAAPLIKEALGRVVGTSKSPPVTAVVIWGGNDGSSIAEALNGCALRVPDDLSVVLVGHVDLESIHLGRFAIAGPLVSETARRLIKIVYDRLEHPLGDVVTSYVESAISFNGSIRAL